MSNGTTTVTTTTTKSLTDLTNGIINRDDPRLPVWEGTGVFDVLMKAVNENINIQYELARITGSDYATVYLGSLETCIRESINYLKESELKQAQIDKLKDDMLTSAKQRELYQRQIQGFDDNKYQKLFESQLSSWGLMFSSGMLTEKPSIITGDKVSQLYTKLTTGM